MDNFRLFILYDGFIRRFFVVHDFSCHFFHMYTSSLKKKNKYSKVPNKNKIHHEAITLFEFIYLIKVVQSLWSVTEALGDSFQLYFYCQDGRLIYEYFGLEK